MSQIDLLTVPECPSPRLQRIAELAGALERAKARFHILTHCDSRDEEQPWMGLITSRAETRSIAQILASEAEMLDRTSQTAYGQTEADVVIGLIAFWDGEQSREVRDLVELRELEVRR